MLYFKRIILTALIILLFSLPLSASSRISSYSLQKADEHALSAPASASSSLESLAGYLTGWTPDPLLQTRSIFRWITANISYDVNDYFSGDSYNSQDPDEVIKRKQAVCSGYANLFQKMAEAVGLEVVTISGYSKGYGYDPSVIEEGTNHAWNGVKLDGRWYLIDSTWAAGHINDTNLFEREFNDFYFLAPPDELIYTHLPAEEKWQLLSQPVSKADFFKSFKVWPEFFEYGVNPINYSKAVIHVEDSINVNLRVPEDVLISARIEKEDRRLARKYTFSQRSNNTYQVKAVFPAPGTYNLVIFGRGLDEDAGGYEGIMEYEIIVSRGRGEAAGFPEIYGAFREKKVRLESPLTRYLTAYEKTKFALHAPYAREVAVIQGDNWSKLTKTGDYFSGWVETTAEEPVIAAQYKRDGSYSYLLKYFIGY